MSLEGKSLFIMTPMYGGQLMMNYMASYQELKDALIKYRVPFGFVYTYNESLITRARNRLVDAYLKTTPFSHSVFIDADIGFHADEVIGMLDADLDIAGAPCVKKSLNWNRIVDTVKKSMEPLDGSRPPIDISPQALMKVGGDFVINFEGFDGTKAMCLGEPMEVYSIGTGLMMVRRNVFEKFRKAYPDRWYEPRGSDPNVIPGPIHDFFRVGINDDLHDYESEDYCFVQDCKKIGFKVWLCPWVRTTHSGTYLFTGDLTALAQSGVGL